MKGKGNVENDCYHDTCQLKSKKEGSRAIVATSKKEINYWCVDCGFCFHRKSIFEVDGIYSFRGLRFLETGSLGGLTSATSTSSG